MSSSSSSLWESLPVDLMELLVESLESFFDRLRFSAVCRSWRDAAAAIRGRPSRRPTLPILTFCEPEDGGTGGGEADAVESAASEAADAVPVTTRCFYSLSEDKIYRRKVPWSRDWNFLGSFNGWLALVDLYATPFLLNPISGERVDLPSLATLSTIIISVETREDDGETLYMYQDPIPTAERELFPLTGKDMRDHFVFRLVLSSSPLDPDCIAMAIVSSRLLLAYARPGGDSWVLVQSELIRPIQVVDYHGCRFYALSFFGNTVSIRFTKPPSPCHDRGHIHPVVELFASMSIPYAVGQEAVYLVPLPSGEIVQVIKNIYLGRPEQDDAEHHTDWFDIHRVKVGNNGRREWVEVDTIDDDDCCFFLGYNQSISLPPFEVLGKYRTKAIFFTDDCIELFREASYGGLDYGIYNVEDGTIERFCPINARRLMPPPMWITPN